MPSTIIPPGAWFIMHPDQYAKTLAIAPEKTPQIVATVGDDRWFICVFGPLRDVEDYAWTAAVYMTLPMRLLEAINDLAASIDGDYNDRQEALQRTLTLLSQIEGAIEK